MTPAVVTRIYIHPVKSYLRVEVDHAVVSQYGFEGDREWQVQGPVGAVISRGAAVEVLATDTPLLAAPG
jgi:uncharacterized protein YcbX